MISISSISDYVAAHPQVPEYLKGLGFRSAVALEWDQAEGLVWPLRLAEGFGDGTKSWGHPSGFDWQTDAQGTVFYEDSAPSSLEQYRGKCSAHLRPEGDGLQFELLLTNESPHTWVDCWGGICLAHTFALQFQSNCELPVGTPDKPWVPTACLREPVERWLKWCPVKAKMDIATRIGPTRGAAWQPQVVALDQSVRAWRVEGNRQQFIVMTSPDAFVLAWGHTPCTDMSLYFGTLEPGQTSRASGAVGFSERSFVSI